MIDRVISNFSTKIDSSTSDSIINAINIIDRCCKSYKNKVYSKYDDEKIKNECCQKVIIISKEVGKSILKAWNRRDKSDKYDWRFSAFVNEMSYCENISEVIAEISTDPNTVKDAYNCVIEQCKAPIGKCSYRYEPAWNGYTKDTYLNYKAIQSRNEKIKRLESTGENRINELKKKRIDDYWKEHLDEKKKIEQEKDENEEMINSLYEELKEYPEYVSITKYEEERNQIIEQKENLVSFRLIQKNKFEKQIIELNRTIEHIREKNSVVYDLYKKIDMLNRRNEEIKNELTRER